LEKTTVNRIMGADSGRGRTAFLPARAAGLLLSALVATMPVWTLPARAAQGPAPETMSGVPLTRLEDAAGSVRPVFEYLPDPGGDMGLARAASATGWRRARGSVSLGLAGPPHWFRFAYRPGPRASSWLLKLDYPPLDRARLHVVDPDGGVSVQVTGESVPPGQRPIPHRDLILPLPAAAGDGTWYAYLRVETRGALVVPLSLHRPLEYLAGAAGSQLLLGAYYGLALVMAVFNILVFAALKETSYLWMVGHIATIALSLAAMDGLAYVYLWPQSPAWAQVSVPVLAGLAAGCAAMFTRSFLDIRHSHASLDKVLLAVAAGGVLLSAASLFADYELVIRATAGLVLAGVAAITVTAAATLRRGYRPAVFFASAWAVFLVGVAALVLRAIGLLPDNGFTARAVQVGSGIEITLLTLALADRIIHMRQLLAGQSEKLIQSNVSLEERVARRTNELARANQRLGALSTMRQELLTNVSHELRTPLTAICGFAQVVRQRLTEKLFPALPEDEKLARDAEKTITNLDILVNEGDRLARLVDHVLELSELEAGKVDWRYEKVSLNEVMEAAVQAIAPEAARKGLDIELTDPGPLPRVVTDRGMILRVLLNLLSNAIKFTESGRIVVSAKTDQDHVTLRVEDTGQGLRPEDRQRIFDKFVQVGDALTGKPSGPGLGLAISRAVVEHFDGRIWVESSPGQGSVFMFTLPLSGARGGGVDFPG
jgi:signal transduction histidine kinase